MIPLFQRKRDLSLMDDRYFGVTTNIAFLDMVRISDWPTSPIHLSHPVILSTGQPVTTDVDFNPTASFSKVSKWFNVFRRANRLMYLFASVTFALSTLETTHIHSFQNGLIYALPTTWSGSRISGKGIHIYKDGYALLFFFYLIFLNIP